MRLRELAVAGERRRGRRVGDEATHRPRERHQTAREALCVRLLGVREGGDGRALVAVSRARPEQAGGMRLASMLQDAFFWLLLGVIMAGMVRLGPRSAPLESEE